MGDTDRWIAETIFETVGVRNDYRATRMIVDRQTGLQHLQVFDNPRFGRMMVLDGAVQITTADEFIYHEMMAHVPVYAHGAVRRVLVVGGGDGGLVREILRHPAVEAVRMVEIDADVVAFAREHFPEVSAGAFDDPRLTLTIADGIRFVADTDERYDVVIVDSTDPVGPAAGLFTEAFYRGCRRCLTEGGILVTQSGVPFMQPDELSMAARNLAAAFGEARFFLSAVPTYVGGSMAHGFGCAERGPAELSLKTLSARFAAAPVATRYYTPAVHLGAFALPAFMTALIDGRG